MTLVSRKQLTNFLKAAATAAALAFAPAGLDAGVRLAEDTYLNFGITGDVIYADNLYSSKTRTSDLYSSITPSVTLTHDASNRFVANFSEAFVNHLDHLELDSQYAAASLSYSFEPKALTGASEGGDGPGSRLRMNIDAGFRQIAQNDNTYGYLDDKGIWQSETSLIRRDIYTVGSTAQYQFTDKLNGSAGLNWSYDHFSTMRDRYNDSQSFSVPVSLSYSLSRYQVGLVYNWSYTDIEQNRYQRQTKTGNPGNSTNHYIGASFSGPVPFSSKLAVRGNVGYTLRQLNDRWFATDNVDGNRPKDLDKKNDSYDHATVGFSFALDWQVRGNLRASLSSGRNFELGGRAQAITSTNVRLNVGAALRSTYFLSAFVDYRLQEFDTNGITDRRDNLYSAGVALSYSAYVPTLHSTVSTSLGYRFLADDSNRISNFYANTVSFTLGISY